MGNVLVSTKAIVTIIIVVVSYYMYLNTSNELEDKII